MTLIKLMYEFMKTGLFSVGGGLATLPFLYAISDKTNWFTHSDIADMIAVAESTPGPIGVNMSTFAGFKTSGVIGGVLASFALGLPSVIIILIIAKFLNKFKDNPLIERTFYGLRPASIAMITAAGLNVAKVALIDLNAFSISHNLNDLFIYKAIILAIIIFTAQRRFKVHPVLLIAFAAIAGIIFKF